ncbi:MAG: T9SS type A sorting domain-containing protein, partial [Saprospiraceae bacterium]|nr:T9SS type A sorting domain-containing protein [Saprospiraceae bacterium]
PAGLCRSLYCVVVKITDCEVEELSNNECPTPPPPCSPDCEASFTISNDGACLYEFTNTSSVPTGSQASYLWTFGDGSTSTMESPTHAYSGLTTYTVCLEISTPDGCLDEVCQQVSISETCDEDIFVAYTNCSSSQASEACSFCFTAYGFTGTPGDQIAYYEWTYPGGTYIGQTLAFGGSGLVGDFSVCVTAVTNYGYQYSYCQTWNCHDVPAHSGDENSLRTIIPNTTATATAEKGFEVFPNPATDYLTVTWDNELLAENSDLQIFNASGQIVKTFRVDHQDTEYRINVSDLSSGLYMLSMTQRDGSIVTKRLIIE